MSEYVVVIKDHAGAEKLREQHGPEHFGNIPPLVDAGIVVCGGAMFNEEGSPVGSHIQIVADSREQVLEMLKKDVFARENVWDLESAIIYKFDCAVRKPM
ncbi:hypothetical protein TPHA_0C00950 [Tetrapisispora phaffii CBS 4417]|uniref:YCII-related domain-containing protein n=1 Tax=Tetrapisispora phaffii (strain ATCC 24235 / CBS 4417 / NBRC 1672 / NRRL Y-8282 / UCD 70-5) TaxID=1071381 RepID=G8BR75_TETPH|nr:hypothetical protein TPHA_0C00950 [Tetrapisispora phaffii CBS 4417]CCE62251.1 hypothetical protein TPHA_0C00950 [Tetrapisispora phaffii CBS 4417]